MSYALGGVGISDMLNIRLLPLFEEKILVLLGSPPRIGTFRCTASFRSSFPMIPGTMYAIFPSIYFLILLSVFVLINNTLERLKCDGYLSALSGTILMNLLLDVIEMCSSSNTLE